MTAKTTFAHPVPAKPNATTTQLDAIVIPTHRPGNQLNYAVGLAKENDCCLVVLCSGQAHAVEVISLCVDFAVQCIAINIPSNYTHPLLTGLTTNMFPEAIYGREQNNLALKRNIGLLLGRMAGSVKMLFLDDDISDLYGFAEVMAINDHASGFLMTGFPDNSVIRHAERLSGVEPGVSLSGGALVVNPSKVTVFFPNIYNEDWFFLHDTLMRTPPTLAGTALQQPYDPFRDPMRAVSEEFGDVLAEGIVQLRVAGVECQDANTNDWQSILTQRKMLINNTVKRLTPRKTEANVQAALLSLAVAQARLADIRPETCIEYIAAWRRDIEWWREQVTLLPSGLTIELAVKTLGLV